jgi:hypothetical protein
MKKNSRIVLLSIILLIITLLLYYLSKESFQNSYDLPKIVWSYWDSDTLPEQINLIYQNNKKKLDGWGWDYKLVNNSNKKEFIGNDDDDISTKKLSPQHYADWLRLYLLKKYGGVWMDISIILNENLDRLHNKSIKLNSELTGFDSPIYTDNTIDLPIIENYFIMAPKNSNTILLWYEEYIKAIKKGFKKYKMEQIWNGVNYQNIFGKTNDGEVYLTQHGCLQVVFQKRLTSLPKMHLEESNKSIYKIHYECSWDKKCLQEKINDKSYSKKIPYIKLRGIDRDGLDLTNYFKD